MEIVIRYSIEHEFEEAALVFARRVFAAFDEAVDALTLVPDEGDDLVVYLDGRLVHSVREAGRMPKLADLRVREECRVDDEPTCGKGLAAHASLPAAFGAVIDAVAENLEGHLGTLDLTDENSRLEHEAYERLVKEHRAIAAQLRATAEAMAGYRDLPMGRHDEEALGSPRIVDAFVSLVRVERELLTLLGERVAEHEQMLAEFGGAGAGS
jgi:hypothetical protein